MFEETMLSVWQIYSKTMKIAHMDECNGSVQALNGHLPTEMKPSPSSESINSANDSEKVWEGVLKRPTTGDKLSVPLLFREPYVNTGFRHQGFAWYHYFPNSLFQLHNESMNVWTHLIAVVLMAQKLVRFSETLDYLHDPYTWPLIAGLSCGTLLYICSAGAHALQSHSQLMHYTAFMVDYAGIGIYGLGSVIVHQFYCSTPWFYDTMWPVILPAGCVLAWAICICCTVSKVYYTRPYPFVRKMWQMSPVAGIYAVLIAPVAQRLLVCWSGGGDCGPAVYYHVCQIAWFFTSGFFFASDIPQRFLPGRCDFFFHSHQLFHAAIMTCTLHQMDAVYLDFRAREDVIRMRAQPTLLSAFGPVLAVILSEVITIVIFHLKVKATLKEQETKDK